MVKKDISGVVIVTAAFFVPENQRKENADGRHRSVKQKTVKKEDLWIIQIFLQVQVHRRIRMNSGMTKTWIHS